MPFSTASHRMMNATHWEPKQTAYKITDTLWTSPATTDSHMATTPEGEVVINTGFAYAAPRHRAWNSARAPSWAASARA